VAAESTETVEGAGHASAAAALMELQAAVGAPRVLTLVDHHRGLIAPRTKAGRYER